MLCPSVNRPNLIHLPASSSTCRLWDLHSTEEEQQENGRVRRVKFSEDGSFLAVSRMQNLVMWKTSTWECLWSVPRMGYNIDFSPDGLRVLMEDSRENVYAYDVRSGDALVEIDTMPNSIYDHVHMFQGEVGEEWECGDCESSLLNNGEYWFTASDGWLWVVEEGVARRLIHIPEYFFGIKAHSGYVAVRTRTGSLVLNTACNSKAV